MSLERSRASFSVSSPFSWLAECLYMEEALFPFSTLFDEVEDKGKNRLNEKFIPCECVYTDDGVSLSARQLESEISLRIYLISYSVSH
jgi:hypothetical protein